MRDFLKNTSEIFNVRSKGMRLVLFNVMVVTAILGGVFSIILSCASLLPLQPLPIYVVGIMVAAYPFYLANYKGRIIAASNVLTVLVCFFMFPSIFFSQGGIESGMSNWFSLGILFIFLLFDGMNFIIMLSLDTVVIGFCYWIAYQHPQLVHGQMSRASFFLDDVQSIFVTTLAVGLIVKAQAWMQKQQDCIVEEKNRQLVEVTHQAMQAQQEAEVANHSKSNFLANMSHEIRTPINTVLGMDEMILRETKEENTKSLAQDILISTESLLEIVNDILDFSRIESGKLEIMEDDYDLCDVVHDAVSVFGIRAREKGLYLNIYVDEKLPAMYRGDSLRLRQIINNIMSNAIKYTKEGGISFSVSGYQEGDSEILHFEIEDTGVGIREEDLHRLFEAFERIDEKSNRNIEGTGLGMAITANLLHMMESGLQVKSLYGQGSVFYFDLRQRVKDWTPVGSFQEREKKKAYGKKEGRYTFLAPHAHILLVDDNAMNRKVFCKLLKHTQMQIDEADNGFSCLEMVKNKHYDMIFLDHMMPELDGVETFSYMQSMQENLCKDTPVIVLTANTIIGAKEQYLQIGFTDYLSKPIDSQRLENIIVEQLTLHNIRVEIVDPPVIKEEEPVTKNSGKQMDLPQVEGFDWEYGLLHFPSGQMLWESVEDFYSGCESAVAELELLFQDISGSKGMDAYRIKVHALKSNLALIGAVQASALAKILEYAARDGEEERLRHLHGVLMEEVRTCRRNLSAHMQRAEKKKEKMTDPAWILGMLSMLRADAENLDYDGMDQIMQMLDTYAYEDKLQTGINRLADSVRGLDPDTSISICDQMKDMLEKGEAAT